MGRWPTFWRRSIIGIAPGPERAGAGGFRNIPAGVFVNVDEQGVTGLGQTVFFIGNIQGPGRVNPEILAILPQPEGFAFGAGQGFAQQFGVLFVAGKTHRPEPAEHNAQGQRA